MGYYVNISSVNWTIEETPEALSAIREMPKKYKAIQRGGGSNGERWFSWMNDTDIENAPSVEYVFKQLGFETTRAKDGTSFDINGYESKNGQEDLFLGVMAPWTLDGSEMEWVGEDGAFWQYVIKDGRMYFQEGSRSYSEPQPYAYNHIELVPTGPGFSENRWESIDVDPLDPNVQEKLDLAESWHQEKEVYYEKLRKEREEAQSANA